MAASSRAPKQWALGKVETVTTFNAWKDNLLYILSLEVEFAPFFVVDAAWSKYSSTDVNRRSWTLITIRLLASQRKRR